MIGLNGRTGKTRKKILSLKGKVFQFLAITATLIGVISLAVLMTKVIMDSAGWLDWQFLTGKPSRFPEKAGIYPMLLGSLYMIALVALFSLMLGVGAAINLEEYLGNGRLKRLIEMNIANLAGVPSIVYGLLGLGIFVGFLGLNPGIVLVGALTLTLRILPIMIISSQEAIRAVPFSLREASYSLGATKWQTIKNIVLPEAMPGIMTGTILALANAIGETAPLIMIGVATAIFSAPEGIMSPFGALPLQIFAWSDFPKEEFQHGVTPAAVVVLLVILVLFNGVAISIRKKYRSEK